MADALRLVAVSRHGLSRAEILAVLPRLGYIGDSEVTGIDWAVFRLGHTQLTHDSIDHKAKLGHAHLIAWMMIPPYALKISIKFFRNVYSAFYLYYYGVETKIKQH